MEMDIPLTEYFVCPICGFRGLFSAEPAAYVKCICGKWWVIGDFEYFVSLTDEEREKLRTWNLRFFKDHRELNHGRFSMATPYS